jgi:hypothetical protein
LSNIAHRPASVHSHSTSPSNRSIRLFRKSADDERTNKTSPVGDKRQFLQGTSGFCAGEVSKLSAAPRKKNVAIRDGLLPFSCGETVGERPGVGKPMCKT